MGLGGGGLHDGQELDGVGLGGEGREGHGEHVDREDASPSLGEYKGSSRDPSSSRSKLLELCNPRCTSDRSGISVG